MGDQNNKVIIGVSAGVAFGILVASCVFIAIRLYRKRSRIQHRSRELSGPSLPIRANGDGASIESSASLSYSKAGYGLRHMATRNSYWGWRGHQDKGPFLSMSGIPRYLYKDIQKATQNFTTILGEGSFGPVYKAIMPTSEVVAVKVLANNSRQGEREFQTERKELNIAGENLDMIKLVHKGSKDYE